MEQEYDDVMPVFLINGFLEAGKTQFLKFTMEQDYFQAEGKTLLILCEEGEEEYSEEFLTKTNTIMVTVESQEELTPSYMEELELLHNPERVLIEWNGMWLQDKLLLPKDWSIHQQITIIDASTLDVYLKNMKAFLGSMVRYSELVICNRCDGIEDLDRFRLILKAMNNRCEFIFEDTDGEIEKMSEGNLPYDLNQEIVELKPEDYGIWYMDCMDKPERYEGKVVEFTAMALKTERFPKNYFVPGRMAMTCCEDDMAFLGYVCKAREARLLETKQWVRVRARIVYEFWQDYGEKGPVLYAEWVKDAEPIQQVVQF